MSKDLKKWFGLLTYAFTAVWVATLVIAIFLFMLFREDLSSTSITDAGEEALTETRIFLFASLIVGAFGLFCAIKFAKFLKTSNIRGGQYLIGGFGVLLVISLLTGTIFGGNIATNIFVNVKDSDIGTLSIICLILFTIFPVFTYLAFLKATNPTEEWSAVGGASSVRLSSLILMIVSIVLSPLLLTCLNAYQKFDDPTILNVISAIIYAGSVGYSLFTLFKSAKEVYVTDTPEEPLNPVYSHYPNQYGAPQQYGQPAQNGQPLQNGAPVQPQYPNAQHPTQPQQPGAYPQYPQQPGAYPQYPQQPGAYPQYPQQPGAYPQYPQQPGAYPQYPQQPGAYTQYPQQPGAPVYPQYYGQPMDGDQQPQTHEQTATMMPAADTTQTAPQMNVNGEGQPTLEGGEPTQPATNPTNYAQPTDFDGGQDNNDYGYSFDDDDEEPRRFNPKYIYLAIIAIAVAIIAIFSFRSCGDSKEKEQQLAAQEAVQEQATKEKEDSLRRAQEEQQRLQAEEAALIEQHRQDSIRIAQAKIAAAMPKPSMFFDGEWMKRVDQIRKKLTSLGYKKINSNNFALKDGDKTLVTVKLNFTEFEGEYDPEYEDYVGAGYNYGISIIFANQKDADSVYKTFKNPNDGGWIQIDKRGKTIDISEYGD